ncbi:uncharacterized protein F4822DRAFT_242048 [Hypoxylon trugodes]|uniref:uncharacterized protein n=1 Tax=Hypoxylon trugodes TaxID=326681 RepID=UPI0021A1D968|nr:uncharacterized protein F4822DRAFT_242048 [Hypoxylon trugodes]KAI1388322.1 hypothetical protein F4822DRAFT_242048 [Hypoxylon trugodes]
MSEEETSPLLSAAAKGKTTSRERAGSSESTPLLSSSSGTPRYDGENDERDRDDAVSIRSQPNDAPTQSQPTKKSRRWPSFIAMGILAIVVITIIVLAFIVPEAVQEYAQEATVFEPTNLALESITMNGVRVRVQADFHLDGSRVSNDNVRRVGKATGWVAHQLESHETKVDVRLPEYDNLLLGSAIIPPVVLNLREGDVTKIDFVTEITPGGVEGIRIVATKWFNGDLDKLRLNGVADLSIKSGIIPLGTHTISESFVFEANKVPAIPKYNITRFNVADGPMNGSMLVDASLIAFNEYPIKLDIPELAFDILVPGCATDDPFILVAEAATSEVHVLPRSDVNADVNAVIRELPDSLTHVCPDSTSSPLDLLLRQYMHGDPATLFVRGSSHPDGDTPKWIADILSSVTVPVPFPGRTLDGLLRNFSLTDVHFSLPNPDAGPDDPDANPQVSGNILVTAGLPSEMNFGIDVTNVRAIANVTYKSKKMGELNLREWQQANSTRVKDTEGDGAMLMIQSRIVNAPLNVTDANVFGEVVRNLFFSTTAVRLHINALVDIKVHTTLGNLTLKDVPAEGNIPVKPLPKGSMNSINPKVGSLQVLDTTSDSITLQALINMTNPTPYTAHVPYVNVHVINNGSILGSATVENLDVVKGPNTNVLVTAKWNPPMGGDRGRKIGRNLISQYLSGWNTSITVQPHRDSIPGQHIICKALSQFNMTFAAPKLDLPGDTPEERSHFIRDATFHFFTSTATFTLVSPLQHNTLYLDFVNATALFNHTEPVGQIVYDLPFSAPPGKSQTPRLPVSWSIGSVGYDAVKKAIGGKLKLDAYADVDMRLGNWKESLWYRGNGIGASVQL